MAAKNKEDFNMNEKNKKSIEKIGLFVKGAAKELTSEDGKRKVKDLITAMKKVNSTFDINR